MTSKRVLFFPWGAGGGAAYTGHCLVLADVLKNSHYKIGFSSGGLPILVSKAGYEVLHQELPVEGLPEHAPPYLPFANLERVYSVAARYYRFSKLKQQYQEDLRIIDSFRPDVVVVDMNATAAMAARKRSIPVVSVAEADFVSRAQNSWMPWFSGDPQDLLPYPSCLDAFNQLASEIGQSPIFYLPDLLWGDMTLIPSIPKLDPLDSTEDFKMKSGLIHYVGPLYWDPPWVSANPPNIPKKEPHQKNIYVTLGSGGMGLVESIQRLLNEVSNDSWNVFVSLGLGPKDSVELPRNATRGGFTGLNIPLQWADLVVNHGGSATVLASLQYGKPMVIVPFMSECEMNGRNYVEKPGCGLVVRTSSYSTETKRLVFTDRFSVAEAIQIILSQPSFSKNAQILGAELKEASLQRDILGKFATLFR